MAQEQRHTRPTSTERLLVVLNERTPLAAVLQDIVASYLEGAKTLFVADFGNHVIRAVDLEDCTVRTFAGRATQPGHADGKDGAARFKHPCSIAVDRTTNTLLVCEYSCIRRITTDGVVSTLCGDAKEQGYCEGVGAAARFDTLSGAVVVARSLFVCDSRNHCVRRIPLDGQRPTELFAGTPGQEGRVDGKNAKFDWIEGLAADSHGNLFVCDHYTFNSTAIRKITPTGVVSSVALAHDRTLGVHKFSDIAVDEHGRLLLVDVRNQVLRSVDLETNVWSTIAETSEEDCRDGCGKKKKLENVFFFAVDGATGRIFASCGDSICCRLEDGSVYTVCGKADQSGHKDGVGTEARFRNPLRIALL